MASVSACRASDAIGSHFLLLFLFLFQQLNFLDDLTDTESSPVLKQDIDEYLCLATEVKHFTFNLRLLVCKRFFL